MTEEEMHETMKKEIKNFLYETMKKFNVPHLEWPNEFSFICNCIFNINYSIIKNAFKLKKFTVTENFCEEINYIIQILVKENLINPCYIALSPLNEK